ESARGTASRRLPVPPARSLSARFESPRLSATSAAPGFALRPPAAAPRRPQSFPAVPALRDGSGVVPTWLPHLFVLNAVLDDHDRIPQDVDVLQRIAVHGDHIRPPAWLEGTVVAFDAHRFGWHNRRRANRGHRIDAELAHPR